MQILNVGYVPITHIECTISPDIGCPSINLHDTLWPGEKLIAEGRTGKGTPIEGRTYTIVVSPSGSFANTATFPATIEVVASA